MGLFSNIRADILEEFNSYVSDIKHDIKYNSNDTFNTDLKPMKPRDNDLIEKLEFKRWGYYPICPHCGHEKYYALNDNRYKCANSECYMKYNVLAKTVLENTKIELNKWYDIAQAYRNDASFSTRSFCKKVFLTQKTTWWILTKLKSSPFINEQDISIIQILLTPNPFTHKSYVSTRPTFKEFKKDALIKLEKTYSCAHPHFELIGQLLTVIETHFDGKQYLLIKEIGLSKNNLSRYLKGQRKLTKQNEEIISNFIKQKTMSGYEYLLNQSAHTLTT